MSKFSLLVSYAFMIIFFSSLTFPLIELMVVGAQQPPDDQSTVVDTNYYLLLIFLVIKYFSF